jgi:hypothetical protein
VEGEDLALPGAHGAGSRDSSATPTPAASGSSAPGRRERPAGDRAVDGSQLLFALPSGRTSPVGSPTASSAHGRALARLVSCSAAVSSSLRMRYSGSCLRPGGLLHMRGCDPSMAAAATHPPAFSYVLYHRDAANDHRAQRTLNEQSPCSSRYCGTGQVSDSDNIRYPDAVDQNRHETTTHQRLRWSAWVWSPPPESNRRPHPYHGTTRNRCANRRFPRSRPTVRAEVIGSPSAKLCAHFLARCWSSGRRRRGAA